MQVIGTGFMANYLPAAPFYFSRLGPGTDDGLHLSGWVLLLHGAMELKALLKGLTVATNVMVGLEPLLLRSATQNLNCLPDSQHIEEPLWSQAPRDQSCLSGSKGNKKPR